MHQHHLEWLRCPECGGQLRLEEGASTLESSRIMQGLLRDDAGHSYPIEAGVPRLVRRQRSQSTETLGSFNYQYGLEERIFEYDVVRVRDIVRQRFGLEEADVAGRAVYVIGCGNGAELTVLSRLGARVVFGIDLTSSIEDALAHNVDDEKICVIQADAMRPPFPTGAFDLIYSDGVLPHTPDPIGVLLVNLELLRPDGGEAYVRTLFAPETTRQKLQLAPRLALREITSRLPPRLLWKACLGMGLLNRVPVVAPIARKLFLYHDPARPDVWTTRLVNFRMYGTHTYRKRIGREEVGRAVREAHPDADFELSRAVMRIRI